MKRTNGRGNKRMSAIVYKDFTYKDKEAVSSSKVKFVCLLVWFVFLHSILTRHQALRRVVVRFPTDRFTYTWNT